jgi:Icc-related predicted phosphoesterase
MGLKIWHISDTHTFHELLHEPEGIDMVIFSGDCSNPRDPYANEPEVRNFLTWFSKLKAPYKIFVAGNHDTSIEKGLVDKETFDNCGVIYLENKGIEIEGLKIWGSPNTPTFGFWSFMKAREKINRVWENIPDDTDILIVHGPPKGILDHSYNREGVYERCGCSALRKHVLNRIKPKLMCFGHIHNSEDIINQGTLILNQHQTIFSNGSVVEDGKFGKLSSNGNLFTI